MFAGQVAALQEKGRIAELRLAPLEDDSILGNMYVGKVENIAGNIGAAFVQIAPGERCYLPLKEAEHAAFCLRTKKGSPCAREMSFGAGKPGGHEGETPLGHHES